MEWVKSRRKFYTLATPVVQPKLYDTIEVVMSWKALDGVYFGIFFGVIPIEKLHIFKKIHRYFAAVFSEVSIDPGNCSTRTRADAL